MTNTVTDTSAPPAGKKRRPWLSWTLRYIVPLAISIGLCYLLFTDIDFNEMIDIIRRECHFEWIALALCLSIFSHLFRALRWGLQLRALGVRVPVFPLLLSIFGCYAVNLVFPRLGEIWRTGYIAHRQNAPFTTVFGSMIGDRLADTATVLLLVALAFALAAAPVTQYLAGSQATYDRIMAAATSPWIWCAIVLAAVLVWMFFRIDTRNAKILKVRDLFFRIWHGFAVLFTMPRRTQWLLLTVCLWGCYFVQMWVQFFAFDFTADIYARHGITAVLVTFVLSSLSMGVPSNGGIGPWQWAVIFALGIYGLDRTSAGAFANVVLGSQTVLLILLGIFTFACIALGRRRRNAKDSKSIYSISKNEQ